MSSPERGLRFFQLALVAFIVACFLVKRLGRLEVHDGVALRDWLVIALATWSAISGFTMQRSINRKASLTPLARWRTGHVLRLCSATAVGMWGMVLHYFGASEWLSNALLGLAMVLLIAWRPGPIPAQAQPEPPFRTQGQ